MDKSYLKYCTGARWTKEFGEEIQKYKYVRQVYLDSENESDNLKEQNTIRLIQERLYNDGIKDEEGMNKILEENRIFKFDKDIKFNIKRISYKIIEEKIKIIDCAIIFLFNEKNEFFNFLEDFTNRAKVGNIELNLPLVKRNFRTRKNCKEIVKELLENNLEKKIDESDLVNFFKDKDVVYSEEISLNEIRSLKDATKDGYAFYNPFIKGILMFFINSENMSVDLISKTMKDASFYVGAKSNTDSLYAMKIDKNYKEPKIKVILTIEKSKISSK